MSSKVPNTPMYEALVKSINIAMMDSKKIPDAVLLSQSASNLIRSVSKDIPLDRFDDKTVNGVIKLNEMLEVGEAFLLPYRHYFFIRKTIFKLDPEDDKLILKLPVRAFCTKEMGIKLFQIMQDHFRRYAPREDEMVYVIGKTVDTMWIAEELFHLDFYLFKSELPDEVGKCSGISDRVNSRQADIKRLQKESGKNIPRGTFW